MLKLLHSTKLIFCLYHKYEVFINKLNAIYHTKIKFKFHFTKLN